MGQYNFKCLEEDCKEPFEFDCFPSKLEEHKVCPKCGSRNVDLNFDGDAGKGYKNFGLIWRTPVYGGSGNG